MIQDVFGFTAALAASANTGLLAALLDGPPRSAAEHAQARGFDVRATTLVFDVLVAYGLATKTDDKLTPVPQLVEIIAGAPGGTANTLALWGHVPQFVKTGAPFVKMDSGREAAYAGVVATLGRMFAGPAAALAGLLPRAPSRVLDIGCGSGVWSLAIASHHRGARVTGLDLPAVLEAFHGRATELGLTDRIATLPGDVHQLAIPRSFDLVVVANVLRIENAERARSIVQSAAAAVEPGGQLLIVDALAGGTPAREQARSVYALHLGMRTEHGQVYSRDQISGWIREANLGVVQSFELEGLGALGAILAG